MTKRRRQRPDPVAQQQALDALYATLPTIDCRGACWDSCSSIRMTRLEHRRTEHAGVAIPEARPGGPPAVCPALTMLHQCSIHAVRPAICRLWGVTESMPCTFGCRPDDGRALLTDEQMYEFLAQVYDISGEHAAAEEIREPWRNPDKAREVMRQFRAQQQEQQLRDDVRRRQMIASGQPVLFVRGRGQVSSTPPAAGANS